MGIVRISSADDSRLVAYRSLTDRQLRDRLEPASGVLIAESEKVVRVALAAGLTPLSMLIEDRWLEQRASLVETVLATGRSADICVHAGHVAIKERLGEPDVYVLPHEQASRLVGYNVTRGVLCALHRPQQQTASELLTSLTCARRLAVLEAVTDATNVGARHRCCFVDAHVLRPTCASGATCEHGDRLPTTVGALRHMAGQRSRLRTRWACTAARTRLHHRRSRLMR